VARQRRPTHRAGARRAVHAHRLSVRRLPRWHRPERAAVPAPRRSGGPVDHPDRTLRLPRRLSRLRGAHTRGRRTRPGDGRPDAQIAGAARAGAAGGAVSALATKLRQLRADAGQTSSIASARSPITVLPERSAAKSKDTSPSTHKTLSPDLRRLLQRHAQLKRDPAYLASNDRDVPGIELSPGLRYTEANVDWLAPPDIVDAAFARMESVHHRRLL